MSHANRLVGADLGMRLRWSTTGAYSDIDQSVCGMSTMSVTACTGPNCRGCSGRRTHAGAVEFCHDMGARLCSAVELEADVARGKVAGCKLDKKQVWTKDTCDDGAGFLVVYGSTRATSNELICERSTARYRVRCCGDAVGPEISNELTDIAVAAAQSTTLATSTVVASTSSSPSPTPAPPTVSVTLEPTVLPEPSLPRPGDADNATDGHGHHTTIPPVTSTGAGLEQAEVSDLLGGSSAATHWQPDGASPYPRFPVAIGEVGATKSGNSIYVLGKARVGSASFFRLDLADPDTGWGVVPNPPQLSDHHALVAVGTQIFVLGGMFWNCPRVDCLGLLQIFDTESETWSYGSPLPWVVQGKPSTTFPLDGLWIMVGSPLDPPLSSDPPDAHSTAVACGIAGSVSAVAIGSHVYACGGLATRSTPNNPKTCGKYDPEQDHWLPMRRMIRGVNHAAAGTDGTKMYAPVPAAAHCL